MAGGSSVDQSDLKRVKGIGAKVEAGLKDAGITDLGRLARTPVNKLAAVLDGLAGNFDADRIIREDWLSQAATLAAVPPARRARQRRVLTRRLPEAIPGARCDVGEDEPAKQMRHDFTVEVQLPITSGNIGSWSKIVHVQTGDEATWAGWDGRRIAAFIADRAGPRSRTSVDARHEALAATAPAPDSVDANLVDEHGIALHTFATVPATGPEVTTGEAITATLSFGTAALDLPADEVVHVKADVYTRRPPPGKCILVGSVLADISRRKRIRLQIPCDLAAVSHPVGLFAAVQLFTVSKAGRTPSSGLPNADMTLSRTDVAAPGGSGSVNGTRRRSARVSEPPRV